MNEEDVHLTAVKKYTIVTSVNIPAAGDVLARGRRVFCRLLAMERGDGRSEKSN